MAEYDLTVAITAHNETLVAGPCLLSVEAAIEQAEKAGFRVQRLIGLDNATPDADAYFRQDKLKQWELVEFSFGDPFKVRNAMVECGAGKWIAFVDADDMVSENWFVKAAQRLTEAEKAGEKVVVHPEMNWIFEAHEMVFVKPDMNDEIFLPHYFYFANYYDMMAMAPREAALQTPYGDRDLKNGFGYQDWQWNIETIGAGWRHVVVRDTIIFKRRRMNSVSEQNRSRRCLVRDLEPMAIDRIREFGQRVG
ncbi:MAG: glycosyltransferase family 2 protein [Hyphomonas sp.]|nr:glycosyltransferase family 2 protein [Hyphomonas sp.]